MKNAKITKWSYAYKGCASTYNVEILNSLNPELQLKDIECTIKKKLIDLLPELRGFKFVTTLVLESKKIKSNDESKYSTFSSNSKAERIINESDIDEVFEPIYITIMPNIQKSLSRDLHWIAYSVIDHTINIWK